MTPYPKYNTAGIEFLSERELMELKNYQNLKTIIMKLSIDWGWSGWGPIGSIATGITAVIAAIYTIYTYHLLKATKQSIDKQTESNDRQRKLAELEIYMKIADKIDAEETQLIIDACVRNNLSIKNNNVELLMENGEKLKLYRTVIATHILLPFTDLANFWKQGLIGTDAIMNGFGYLILSLGRNNTVIDVIKFIRQTSGPAYRPFEELYIALHKMLPENSKKEFKPNFN